MRAEPTDASELNETPRDTGGSGLRDRGVGAVISTPTVLSDAARPTAWSASLADAVEVGVDAAELEGLPRTEAMPPGSRTESVSVARACSSCARRSFCWRCARSTWCSVSLSELR